MGWNYLDPMGQFMPDPRVDQLYQQYKNILNSLQNNMCPQPNQQRQQNAQSANPAMGQRGMFIQVNDYKDVENYPVSPDGTPTLFFDYQHGFFWSKKLLNGQTVVQDFVFAPRSGMTQSETADTSLDDLPVDEDKAQGVDMNAILEQLEILSKKVDALSSKEEN